MNAMIAEIRPARKATLYRLLRSLIGKPLLDQWRLRRNFYFYRKTGIIFIHIPKAAGSSISYSLYGQSLGHFSARDLSAFQPSTFSTLYSFSVVRHPLGRLKSAYNYIRSNGTEFGSIAPNEEYLADDFQTFEDFLTSWLPRQNSDTLDPVLRPQSDFVYNSEGSLLVDEIFKLEHLEEHWSNICSKGRLYKRALERRNVNSYRDSGKDDDANKLQQTVAKFYRKDLEIWEKAL